MKDIHIFKIDKCEIFSGKKCDFGATIPFLKLSILIELKGNGFEHAISQLDNTLKNIKLQFPIKEVYIILTRGPLEHKLITLTKSFMIKGIKLTIKLRKYEFVV
ncbi:hypothetical protein [Leptospira kmetyi]|uniref:Uncharacterized protein n=1 Tax=Leptospira kmetyi TaxID=408139 RepID=A0ABX4N939_9LEPT|nr:hypothetical protein [Leptospira kmetyi]PJZ29093.1 hypothetical protein CH378_14500 [Leptospira kmetyi]PJZ39740.1 hypothetical protein CH370_20015 [Leptospira kmetyi]